MSRLFPLKIHQIWIGSDVPEELKQNCERWKEMHPLCDYKLWVDADLPDFYLKNQVALITHLIMAKKLIFCAMKF